MNGVNRHDFIACAKQRNWNANFVFLVDSRSFAIRGNLSSVLAISDKPSGRMSGRDVGMHSERFIRGLPCHWPSIYTNWRFVWISCKPRRNNPCHKNDKFDERNEHSATLIAKAPWKIAQNMFSLQCELRSVVQNMSVLVTLNHQNTRTGGPITIFSPPVPAAEGESVSRLKPHRAAWEGPVW